MDSDTIFLVGSDEELVRIPHRHCESEELVNTLLEKHPELLVGEQISPEDPPRWLFVKREVGVPDQEKGKDRWATDHLLLDHNAKPTFVEVKRSTDTRIRREVVGQMLDYAANAKVHWPEDKLRSLAEEVYGGQEAVDARLQEFFGDGDNAEVNADEFWARAHRYLRNGEFRLLFVADIIPTELRRIIEFLNEQMQLVEVLGVEIRQYEGQGVKALVPRVVGQTEAAREKKPKSSQAKNRTTRDAFLAECSGKVREFFVKLLDSAESEGFRIGWGVKGFSVRFPSPSGNLLTFFYAHPASNQVYQKAVFQASLGYIEDGEVTRNLRDEFMSKVAFEERGERTLHVVLDDETATRLMPIIPDLLDIAKRYGSQVS